MLCSMICNCKCLWICFSKRILDCDKLVHLKVVFANIKLKTWAAVSFWFRSLSPSGCGCHLCTWLCSMTALKVMNVPLLLPSIPVLNLIEYQIQNARFFLPICSVFFFPDLYLYEASDTFLLTFCFLLSAQSALVLQHHGKFYFWISSTLTFVHSQVLVAISYATWCPNS